MWNSLPDWVADWRCWALLAALVLLLYIARESAHRLIRAVFSLVSHLLRLTERWMQSGAQVADARHGRLMAGLVEDELRPRIAAETKAARRSLQQATGEHDERKQGEIARLAAHVDEHRQVIESYGVHVAAIRHGEKKAVLGYSAGTRFVFAFVLMIAVGIAGWLNFALLERPMTEVVGDSYRVMGIPIYRLAALAIIVLEVAVGMVLLEALGGTTMFPQFEAIEHRRGLKLAIVVTMASALFVLAAIEATLALTRDDLSRLERELMGTLANTPPSETAQSVGQVARYAQAAFGFVIPFAMAFLGFAIEMLVRNGRIVAQVVVAEMLKLLAFLLRLLRGLTVGLMTLVVALYDFAIFLPLGIEGVVRRLRSGARPGGSS